MFLKTYLEDTIGKISNKSRLVFLGVVLAKEEELKGPNPLLLLTSAHVFCIPSNFHSERGWQRIMTGKALLC